jgi:hypothetical protein
MGGDQRGFLSSAAVEPQLARGGGRGEPHNLGVVWGLVCGPELEGVHGSAMEMEEGIAVTSTSAKKKKKKKGRDSRAHRMPGQGPGRWWWWL